MATHSSVLAWRIPGTGEPAGLPSMGSHRVGHNWSDLAAAWETQVRSLSKEDPLEQEMATHSNILAKKIPWTEEPGGLQSTGSQKSQTWFNDWTYTTQMIHSALHYKLKQHCKATILQLTKNFFNASGPLAHTRCLTNDCSFPFLPIMKNCSSRMVQLSTVWSESHLTDKHTPSKQWMMKTDMKVLSWYFHILTWDSPKHSIQSKGFISDSVKGQWCNGFKVRRS